MARSEGCLTKARNFPGGGDGDEQRDPFRWPMADVLAKPLAEKEAWVQETEDFVRKALQQQRPKAKLQQQPTPPKKSKRAGGKMTDYFTVKKP